MNIGFIGLGQMGSAMAAQLLGKGHAVTVWNRSPDKALPLVAAGARQALVPADAAQGDLVITMLADDPAVEAVVYGEHGVLGQPALHVSQSTISLSLAERLTRDHGAGALVSAPVFGRPSAAQAAALFVVVAGAQAAVDRAMPALASMSQAVHVAGSLPSQANLVKLGGNFMLVAMVEAFAEAMNLAAAGGVERRVFYESITRSLFNLPAARGYGELLVTGAFRPAGFPALLGLKDMNLVDAAASAHHTPMPMLGVLRDHLRTVTAGNDTDLDLAAIALAVGQVNGLASVGAPASHPHGPRALRPRNAQFGQ